MSASTALKKRHHPYGGPQRRHVTAHAGHGRTLATDHPAAREERTLFPTTRKYAEETKRILKGGHNQRKLGKQVLKGHWKGMPIYALTLEERATCPASCPERLRCYGNNMHFAQRIVHDEAFEELLWLELEGYNRRHPDGYVVRLHVLGDFYSTTYVGLWRRALKEFPALHVFGFSAWATNHPIGKALRKLALDDPKRFAMRWSGQDGVMGAITVERGYDGPVTVCPAQRSDDRFCGNCTYCWASSKPVAFERH